MSRPRVDLVAPPFRGHLHPILGLARALREVAEVRVLTTAARLPDIAASELTGVGLLGGRENEVNAIVDPARPIGHRPWRLLRQFRATLGVLKDLQAEVESVWRATPPDLVIVDSVLPNIGMLTQRLGARWWTSIASPCAIEPKRGAPGYLGGWRHREDGWGRIRDRAGLAVVRGFKRAVFLAHRHRLRTWGASGVYRADGSEAVYSPEMILGLGMAELEFPRVWPRAFRFLGPVLYTPPAPQHLEPELETGRTHVLVSLGTHLGWAKDSAAAALRTIAEQEKKWVLHFSQGDAARANAPNAESSVWFRQHTYIPYGSWLPRFDAVIHHGGTGVMYECIKAGRPMLVRPMDYDQFDHAARIERAGVGQRIHRWRDIPAALTRVLHDAGMKARSAELQAKFHAYDPAQNICEWVLRAVGQAD